MKGKIPLLGIRHDPIHDQIINRMEKETIIGVIFRNVPDYPARVPERPGSQGKICYALPSVPERGKNCWYT